jgi:hypothetical protein
MTDTMTKMTIALVAHYSQLLDRLESEDVNISSQAEIDLEVFLEEYPTVMNYDINGNYVGPIANENGWTP